MCFDEVLSASSLPCARDQRHRDRDEGPRAGAEAEDPLAAVPLRQQPPGDVAEGVAVEEAAEDEALRLGVPLELAPVLFGEGKTESFRAAETNLAEGFKPLEVGGRMRCCRWKDAGIDRL